MSDAAFPHVGYGGPEPDGGSYTPFERDTPALRNALDLHELAEWLPRLGPVLWLHRPVDDRAFPRARLTPHGVLLLEHPSLSAFADCLSVRANSAITPRGPREWLDLDSVSGAQARIYLLPDTDCMAWDTMLHSVLAPPTPMEAPPRWQAHRAFMHCAWMRARYAWQARIVRMPLLRLPCLQVLGLRDAERVSALGRRLAKAIADNEHAHFVDSEQNASD